MENTSVWVCPARSPTVMTVTRLTPVGDEYASGWRGGPWLALRASALSDSHRVDSEEEEKWRACDVLQAAPMLAPRTLTHTLPVMGLLDLRLVPLITDASVENAPVELPMTRPTVSIARSEPPPPAARSECVLVAESQRVAWAAVPL
jgi:hypothetical protein